MQAPKASSSEEDLLLGQYTILKTIGTGNFAQVKLALHLHTEVQVALKTQEKDRKNATLIANELEIMKSLDHPNIIKLFHVMETAGHIYMVMEYASGGDLAGRIIEVSYMQEEEALHIFTQMVCAVSYCHENSIAHRDIKPENILMDEHRNIKLCDFGLATKVTIEQKLTVFCGTLPYCAPELFGSQDYDPRALDIWSMGVVLYIMMTKHYPFKGTTYEKMKKEMQDPHYYMPRKLPAPIANLIMQLFTIDPVQRPTIHNIMEHEWLKGREELSKRSQSLETLPGRPNPSIMAAMSAMGYKPKDIIDSLHENKFNNVMATYLILKHCGDDANHKANLMQPSVAVTPTHPPTLHLFLKKIGCEPFCPNPPLAAERQSQDEEKLIRKKGSGSHTMTDLPCCQQKTPPPSTATQCGPTAARLMGSNLEKRSTASEGESSGSSSSKGILSENRISQVEPAGKAPPESGLSPQNISCIRSSENHVPQVEPEGEAPPESRSTPKNAPSIRSSENHVPQVEPEGEAPPESRSTPQNAPSIRSSENHVPQVEPEGEAPPESRSTPQNAPSIRSSENHVPQVEPEGEAPPESRSTPQNALSIRSSENHVPQVEPEGEAPPESSSTPQNTPPVKSSKHQSHEDEKLVRKSSKCHSMPEIQHWCQKIPRPSTAIQCGLMAARFMSSSLQQRRAASKDMSSASSSSKGILSENYIPQVELQGRGEAPPKRGPIPQNTPCIRSSENRVPQAEPEGEALPESGPAPQNTPCIRGSKEERPQDVTATDAPLKDRSLIPQGTSEPNFTSSQSQRVTVASPHHLSERWKRVKRRMAECLRSLCCCVRAQRRSCPSQRRVAPREVGDSGVTQNQVSTSKLVKTVYRSGWTAEMTFHFGKMLQIAARAD